MSDLANGRTVTIEKVRGGILHGHWSPGERLQPAELARHFGTSTTVVREALSLLVGDGLVITRPNHGFFVPELDLRELTDLTELRCQTEALAARLAVTRGGLEWESDVTVAHYRLSRIPRRTAEHPDVINPAWQQAHQEFHEALLAACGSPVIRRLARNLADATELYRRWAAPSPSARTRDVEAEHLGLMEAALQHDGDLLAERLRRHYEATLRVVLEAGLIDQRAEAAG